MKIFIKFTNHCALLSVFFFNIPVFNNCFASGNIESLKITEISNGIFVHQGIHVDLEHPNNDDIANIGFIIGEKCVAVIDTGGSLRIGKSLLAAIQKQTSLPVCYVINTHVHFDHVLGNLAFVSEETKFIGHAELADAIEANRAFFLDQYSAALGPDPSAESIIGPDITVANSLEIDLGDRILVLNTYQPAHSHTDLTVFDTTTKTLWAGDLLFIERIPALDGSLKGWISVIEKINKQDINLVIPGHGKPSDNISQAFQAESEYLNHLLIDTRKAVADGMFIDEAINTVGKENKGNWLLHEQHHRRNVSKAFTELEWE